MSNGATYFLLLGVFITLLMVYEIRNEVKYFECPPPVIEYHGPEGE